MDDIILENITKRYGDKTIFDGLSFTFESQKIHVVMGASGCGKTTLMNILAGLTPYKGKITGAYKETSYIFQTPRLIPFLNVLQNVEFVLDGKMPKAEAKAAALAMIDDVSLTSRIDALPSQLSGGEQKRAAIARAFAFPSPLIIADEPFSSLDVSLKLRILGLFKTLAVKSGKTAIVVTHDIDEALSLADDVAVIENGGIKFRLEISSDKLTRDLTDDECNCARKKLYSALTEPI